MNSIFHVFDEVKQVSGFEEKSFTYSSRTKRDIHVEQMTEQGWEESGQVRRLKPGVSLFDATEQDYEWFARFQRTTL